ncbi:Type III restriction enzyme, res subunit:DEAD/DEAH box helicase, N-terminal [Marinobacterium lacunae]|uniref:Type III restriction enzyme, res subunit:DEAD/DEAH box helicase, N-terminal n=1 Tax=Marinobacterium lacunae TaxID=1232683 RepID=A0A081FVM2_9GAMM|nr:DEAD/DEAH box helicase family protein [Marinobacterium lacunae]KEA62577.1 Type III restriction enzyme, res subunit:DEAD/DEAH box helicase, N-terminal [Marinobacterium lacunae]
MKLKFDPGLDYQKDAIDSTLALFEGLSRAEKVYTERGIANHLDLNPELLLKNLHGVQEGNFIEKSRSLIEDDDLYAFPNFSVEMETGTGKTYVYLRTIFELHKRLGLRKFIIVVPSVAIREGVLSSLRLMKEHFQALYDKVPFDHYVYDSKNLPVRQFASANTLQIMVINIQAFQKDADTEKGGNVIHRELDRMSGARPIEFIQEVRPVVVIDEPQSVDTTVKAKRAINLLKPLFALRYSATHKHPYNLVYQLGPVKAYDLNLVKRIAVSSIQSDKNVNQTYLKLAQIGYAGKAKTPSAKVVIYEDTPNGTKEKTVKLKQGTDLSDHTNRSGYHGYVVDEIYAEPGAEYVRFANDVVLEPQEERGSIHDEVLKQQIRETVEEHFRKERSLQKAGHSVKVLSLFFIDKVAHYRYYDENGERQNGKLACWFEEAYNAVAGSTLYKDLPKRDVEQVHNGYFAEVKKRGKVVELKDTSGTTASDADVYELIMQDKERLLDDAEPLRFIFSHSALKEGWDNPNVFQICSLRDMGSEKERRQTLGRGLRLAVDSNGDRIHDPAVNRLTVVASESFEQYAKELQTEMEKDIGGGFKFGRVPSIAFASLQLEGEAPLGQERSKQLWHLLKDVGYLDAKGDITAMFQPDDLLFKLQVPDEYAPLEQDIVERLRSFMFAGRIQDNRKRVQVAYNKRVELNPDFEALWQRISQKTRYSIAFDTRQLIDLASHKLQTMPPVKAVALTIEQTQATLTDAGVGAERKIQIPKTRYIHSHETLPDLLGILQEQTELTRATLFEIIKRCNRLQEFKDNPQGFITAASQEIHKALSELLVDGIKYQKLDGEQYKMELFNEPELEAYLERAYQVQHGEVGGQIQTPYDYIEYDSIIELKTAQALDGAENVKFYCKLPRWFKIPTPVGDYNPDWAVVLEDDKKVYLIRETKTTHDADKRRKEENLKIQCGEAHFKALGGVDYAVATSVAEVVAHD